MQQAQTWRGGWWVGCRNYMRASLGVAESVWKRVLDEVFRLVIVGGALLFFCLGYEAEKESQEVKAGLIAVQAFVSLAVIFVGSNEIPRDLATRNVQFFMSKPLGRGGYLFGKFLGVLILGELVLGLYFLCFGLGAAMGGGWPGWSACGMVVRAALQMVALSGLLVALSVILPEMVGTVFGVLFYILAYAVFVIPPMLKLFLPQWWYPPFLAIYYPLPNWQHYLWTVDDGRPWRFLFLLAVYSAAYAGVALAAADLWFRRRDLN